MIDLIKKCHSCGTRHLKSRMVLNSKTGDYFCPKCVALSALKDAWTNRQDITLIQAQLNKEDEVESN